VSAAMRWAAAGRECSAPSSSVHMTMTHRRMDTSEVSGPLQNRFRLEMSEANSW
jgi:hypothetical protein